MDTDEENEPEASADDDHEMHEDLVDDEVIIEHSSADLELGVSAAPAEIREFCLTKFRSTDFIMEPVLMEFLNRYFAADGEASNAIEALSTSYEGVAQYVNMFAEWLIVLGDDPAKVKEHIESYLEELLIKNFDPKKADRIFAHEGATQTTWLKELIDHKHWRRMIYKLVEMHRECLLLNFAIRSISESGFQNEIPTTTTAVNQMDVFTSVFESAFGRVVDGEENAMSDFSRLITNSECTYLVAQLIMTSLIRETVGGLNLVKITQDVSNGVQGHQILQSQLIAAKGGAWPRAMQAVASMLSKKSLNPADILTLHQMYSTSPEPPPVALLRFKEFVELIIESLFVADCKIPNDHRYRYIFLLGYSASVFERWTSPNRKSYNQTRSETITDDLKITQEAIRKSLELITKGPAEVVGELQAVFTVLKFPVIALGMIYWIGKTVKDPSYFKFAGESRNAPVHLIILDEVATLHQNLHNKVLELLVELFEASWSSLEVLIKLELQKMFLDRMIHLISCGHVIPVLKYVRDAYVKQDTDVSLFRHFVVELLDVMAPPYSAELVRLLLPLVSDPVITGALRQPDGKDGISLFLQEAK